MTPAPPAGVAEPFEREKARILQELEAEVAAGSMHLPGYPDAALKLQQLLIDSQGDVDQIVQAISAEPALATQILRIANASIFNAGVQPARDLRAALQRIGNHLVRAALLAFVVQQLRNGDERSRLRERFNALWRRGVVVGAIARALAVQTKVVAPDVALLAGLAHVAGRLHVLLRISATPWLLESPGFAESVMEQCAGKVGAALLASWEMPAAFTESIVDYGNPERNLAGPPRLVDVLAAAVLLADLLPPSRTDYLDQIHLANVFVQAEPLWKRLRLTRADCSDALHKALDETQQLRAMFGA
jgi:HD-like signal output (HDOD) protein